MEGAEIVGEIVGVGRIEGARTETRGGGGGGGCAARAAAAAAAALAAATATAERRRGRRGRVCVPTGAGQYGVNTNDADDTDEMEARRSPDTLCASVTGLDVHAALALALRVPLTVTPSVTPVALLAVSPSVSGRSRTWQ